MPYTNYRVSHMGSAKAESYDSAFTTNKYRQMVWELEQDILDRILRAFPEREGIAHLDFACGTGRILDFTIQRGMHSVGVDVSADMLKLARQKCPKAQLILGDITKDDILGMQSFDLITAFRFFPNAEKELRESVMHHLVMHLKPGGILVFNNHLHSNSLLYRLSRLLRRGGENGMSPSEAAGLLDSNGLKVKTTYHVGILPITEDRIPLPIPIVHATERVAMRIPLAAKLSQNLIYVCTTKTQPA